MAVVCAGGLFAGGGAGNFVDDFRNPDGRTGTEPERDPARPRGALAEVESRPGDRFTRKARFYFFRSSSNFAITAGFLSATSRVSPGSVLRLYNSHFSPARERTIFQSAMRAAWAVSRPRSSQESNSWRLVWGSPNSVGSTEKPSRLGGGSRSAICRAVGRKSQAAHGKSLTCPGRMVPGQETIIGTRRPPS